MKRQQIVKVMGAALLALGALGAHAEKNTDCITFTSKGAFSLNAAAKGWDGTLYWSTDQENWTEWTWDRTTPLAAAQAGGTGAYKLYVRGTTANTKIAGDICGWVLSTNGVDTVACSGNIETLRGATGNDPSPTKMSSGCYKGMFSKCTALTTAPALPATSLADYCYCMMFVGCTALTTAPALPAPFTEDYCYHYMFCGCTSLKDVPALTAKSLKNNCYTSMFSGCTSLAVNTAAPGKEWKLPNVSYASYSWGNGMFYGTGGDFTGEPAIGKTYYVGAEKKEISGGFTARVYDGDCTITGAGELSDASAIKNAGVTNLVVGAGVTGVGEGAFAYWSGLRDVTIGADVTNVAADAFYRCTYMTNLVVGAGVKSVGAGAFERCYSLEALRFGSKAAAEACQDAYKITARITMDGETPVVDAVPEVRIDGCAKTLYGATNLTDAAWLPIADPKAIPYGFHFFRWAYD